MRDREKYTVLIVDDSSINRDILEHILMNDFEVIQASGGNQALNILEERLDDIDLCLLDILMPDITGFDVLAIMNQRHYIDTTPVIVISGETDGKTIERAYDLGAVDFVAKPFDLRIVRRRALATVMLFERQKELTNLLLEQVEASKNKINELTGLAYYETFFDKISDRLEHNNSDDKYYMLTIDIEHFKMFNDWYGWGEGDFYLKTISDCIRDREAKDGDIGGYLGGDNFAILTTDYDGMIGDIQNACQRLLESYGQVIGFMPLYGVYELVDLQESPQTMYDKSLIAKNSAREDYVNRVGVFDPSMIRKTSDELILLTDVQRGINEKEFTFFLQPKVNMHTGKVIGAEALVRWAHKSKGIVSPGVFVNVLEDNGFITSLDRYIWEEVCIWQRKCIDAGMTPIPISVNVSQIDIFSSDVAEYFIELIDKYKIPVDLIEVEITESAYAKQFELIDKTVKKFRQAGFKVLLDDFGAEYSSLNMLRKLEIDVLKLDMKFLDIDEKDVSKGISIIESIVNMARQLDLPIIVEGVESKEQVEFLSDLGCNYAQGYYFYKPMPVKRFESIITSEDAVEHSPLARLKQKEHISVREFLDSNLFSDNLLNNILGPVAFYEMVGDEISIIRVNEQYVEFSRTYDEVDREDYTYGLDRLDIKARNMLKKIFEDAVSSTSRSSSGTLSYTLESGYTKFVHIRAFFVNSTGNRKVFVATLTDTTKYNEMKEELESLS